MTNRFCEPQNANKINLSIILIQLSMQMLSRRCQAYLGHLLILFGFVICVVWVYLQDHLLLVAEHPACLPSLKHWANNARHNSFNLGYNAQLARGCRTELCINLTAMQYNTIYNKIQNIYISGEAWEIIGWCWEL